LYGLLEAHETQSELSPPEHVAQSEWHVAQPPSFSKRPSAHVAMHSLLWRIGVTDDVEHDVQLPSLPRHVRHVALQLRQVAGCSTLRYMPRVHVDVHVPALAVNVAPATHDVQLVDVLPLHVAHEGSHATHVELASAYLLLGQALSQEPSSKYAVPLEGHERHDALDAPLHVAHEAWQLEHVPCVPTSSTKPPVDGHSATHMPLERKGVVMLEQLRQLEFEGPLHVPQEASHAMHTLLVFAYFPTGVHDARQLPGGSKKGVAEAQVRQSVEAVPEHVAQLLSHATHVSADEALPPEQV